MHYYELNAVVHAHPRDNHFSEVIIQTLAIIFAEVGKHTPMFARFSAVAGERGARISP